MDDPISCLNGPIMSKYVNNIQKKLNILRQRWHYAVVLPILEQPVVLLYTILGQTMPKNVIHDNKHIKRKSVGETCKETILNQWNISIARYV